MDLIVQVKSIMKSLVLTLERTFILIYFEGPN